MSNDLFIDIDKASAELCKRKLSFFVKEFWHLVSAEALIWEPHLDVLCDEIQEVYERVFLRQTGVKEDGKTPLLTRLPKDHDLIINVPPGASKSTICTIMAPAWSWTRDATVRHITGSYSEALATEHSVKSRDIIESDLYKKYFPDIEIKYDKGRKTNYESTKLGQRIATSVGGTITGMHGHVITIDDPINPKLVASQVACDEANNWMDKTLSTRKISKDVTVTILVMQRLSVNDPTGHLLSKQKENIRHVCLPAEISDNVKPGKYKSIYQDGLLSPLRITVKSMKEARIDLGADGYAGQFDQTPVKEGGSIWQKWFIPIDDFLFPKYSDLMQLGSDWDLAYTDDDKNAASAYVTGGKLDGRIYIADLDFAYMEFPEMIKWMKTKKSPHYIEAKASGKSAKQTLTRNGIAAIEVKVQGGADKVSRAKQASPPAEAGLVYIKKSLLDKLYNDPNQGILNFPKSPKKDLADALAQSLQRLYRGAIIVGSGKKSPLDAIN
ncbi:MAG: hypothetical protein IPQ08_15440 [Chitinophagaceae bacterium]|nr:hypothetical protein [Chitinophagaceae bacterium]